VTGRERMLKALRFEQTDRPPHFEVMFELEREAFGVQFPDRNLWGGCSRAEKERMIAACIEIYARIIERFEWDALAVYWPWSDPEGVAAAVKAFGDRILIGTMVGNSIWAIESVGDWLQFSIDLHEHPDRIHAEAERRCRTALASIDVLMDAGADFINLVNDVAGNDGPFISPQMFAEFVTPYLTREVQRIKERGGIAFVHTDGMAMPVLDQLLSTGMDVFQGVDPMAGMDIEMVKRATCGRCALMGNVQCNLLQDGPREKIRESVLYCLEHGTPGGGYVFATSNTIFPGMPLENYEYMLGVFREFVRGQPRRRR